MDKYEHGSDGAQAQAAHEPESADVVNVSEQEDSPLDMILRQGARKMLVAAIEAEVDAYVADHAYWRGADGRRLVVRNGHGRERAVVTPNGPINIRTPRVNVKRVDANGRRFRF